MNICLHVYHMHPWLQQRQKMASDPLELRVTDHHTGLGTNPSSFAKVAEFLTTRPSFQPHILFLCI